MEGYTRLGFAIENPFLGAKLRRVKVNEYSPFSHGILDNIWKDAVLLRDGDPTAPAPKPGELSARRGGRRNGSELVPRENEGDHEDKGRSRAHYEGCVEPGEAEALAVSERTVSVIQDIQNVLR